jgi:hypothetical protein
LEDKKQALMILISDTTHFKGSDDFLWRAVWCLGKTGIKRKLLIEK